jgi:hypothetical protein
MANKDTCQTMPLKDVIHDMLPNWSHIVHVRDIIFIIFFLPIIFIPNKLSFIQDVWQTYMFIVLIKAVSIFFTHLPSSNPLCAEKHYINHCHHNSVSGHASLCMILAIQYIKYGIFDSKIFAIVVLYCVLILITRAHYTVDIIHGLLFAYLISA